MIKKPISRAKALQDAIDHLNSLPDDWFGEETVEEEDFSFEGGQSYCQSKYQLSKHGKLAKHKGWELNLEFIEGKLTIPFNLNVSLRSKTDHAGLHFFFSVWRFKIEFNLYDRRHWNYKEDRWEEHS